MSHRSDASGEAYWADELVELYVIIEFQKSDVKVTVFTSRAIIIRIEVKCVVVVVVVDVVGVTPLRVKDNLSDAEDGFATFWCRV